MPDTPDITTREELRSLSKYLIREEEYDALVAERDGLSARVTELEAARNVAESRLWILMEHARDAVKALGDVLGPEDANERFELLAERFRKETGLWPPGKDCPAAMNCEGGENNMAEWVKWNARRITAARLSHVQFQEIVDTINLALATRS